jgi:hypothetical protein
VRPGTAGLTAPNLAPERAVHRPAIHFDVDRLPRLSRSPGWYFRKRDGESVLDTSHLREYTDIDAFRTLVTDAGLHIRALELRRLWFPLLDPVLFRIGGRLARTSSRAPRARALKVPIAGYYALELVVER